MKISENRTIRYEDPVTKKITEVIIYAGMRKITVATNDKIDLGFLSELTDKLKAKAIQMLSENNSGWNDPKYDLSKFEIKILQV